MFLWREISEKHRARIVTFYYAERRKKGGRAWEYYIIKWKRRRARPKVPPVLFHVCLEKSIAVTVAQEKRPTIVLHCPQRVGDPRLDQVLSGFSARLNGMTYTEMSKLLMFKNIKNLHDDAFGEAQKMSCLKFGNYFPITGLLFTINYKTEVKPENNFQFGFVVGMLGSCTKLGKWEHTKS